MTYIAGVRRRGCVYLVADSAISFAGRIPRHGQQQTTSFGEAQVFEQSQTVIEGGLKLHHLGSIAVAVAGDVGQSNRFLAQLKTVTNGDAPMTEQLLRGLVGTIDSAVDVDFQLLIAMPATPQPLLFSFNAGNDRHLREHLVDGVVRLGSPSDTHVHLLAALLRVADGAVKAVSRRAQPGPPTRQPRWGGGARAEQRGAP